MVYSRDRFYQKNTMSQDIFVHFSTKLLEQEGRTFGNAILPILHQIAVDNPKATLHHGFARRVWLVDNHRSTEVLDGIEETFTNIVNDYHENGEVNPNLDKMSGAAVDLRAKIYFIGPKSNHGLKEHAAYEGRGLKIIDLDWAPIAETA